MNAFNVLGTEKNQTTLGPANISFVLFMSSTDVCTLMTQFQCSLANFDDFFKGQIKSDEFFTCPMEMFSKITKA